VTIRAIRREGFMRKAVLVLVVACITLAATGCTIQFIPPAGPAPLRYRDEIFTDVTKTSDITYGTAVDTTGTTVDLKLDVYQPSGDKVDARPAIIWVHGGSFATGNVDKTSPELVDESNVFSEKGYVNFSIDYRLDPVGCSAAAPTANCVTAIFNAWHDAQAAVRFVRMNASTYGVDPNRIAIGGTSAGAIVALDVGYGSENIGTGESNLGVSSAVGAAVSLSGACIGPTIDKNDAPALLFHGTADTTVPYAWAQNTVKAAQAVGLPVFLTSWQGAGHVPYVQHRQEILDQTTNFLYAELDLDHAAR
jgi:acetyl esterase/lipase